MRTKKQSPLKQEKLSSLISKIFHHPDTSPIVKDALWKAIRKMGKYLDYNSMDTLDLMIKHTKRHFDSEAEIIERRIKAREQQTQGMTIDWNEIEASLKGKR